jgi:hypothetical protein
MTPAAFKRWIRDLQVWCSSCMLAFSGGEPIAVLIGAKRPSGTLVHRIAVHPDHRRRGHGRHLLTSLGSKLAILGPPRIVAEVPDTLDAACGLFGACGFAKEARLLDYAWEPDAHEADVAVGGLAIPLTVDDLAANGMLAEGYPRTCWERSVETLNARKDEISGWAVVSDEQIEAYILYIKDAAGLDEPGQIVSFRSFIPDGGGRLKQLLAAMHAGGITAARFAKVHPEEISSECVAALGFRASGHHLLYGARARAE